MPIDSELFNSWILTPILIFFARIIDVSIGTIRIISLSRGHRLLAPLLGFFEVLVWLLAIRSIFEHLDNTAALLAYPAGFAAGNIVGIWIEDKLALGLEAIRVITTNDASDLVNALRRQNYGVTTFDASGVSGQVRLLFTVTRRKETATVLALIREYQPKAFVSVSDVRSANEGTFPLERPRAAWLFPAFGRKAK